MQFIPPDEKNNCTWITSQSILVANTVWEDIASQSKTIKKVVLAGFYYKGLRFWINFHFKFFEQELFYFTSELAGKYIIRMNEIFEPEALPFRTCGMTTAVPQPMAFSLKKSTCPQMCNYVQLC